MEEILKILLSGLLFFAWELWGGKIIDKYCKNNRFDLALFCIITIVFALCAYGVLLFRCIGVI